MAEPYIGEIRMFAGGFAPVGWNLCDGTIVLIDKDPNLFAAIGTTYGGDGTTTFALPDLRGRVPVHQGNWATLGLSDGASSVSLSATQMPAHAHGFYASTGAGTGNTPVGGVPGEPPTISPYIEEAASTAMAPQALALSGGGRPHDNLQPFVCISFIIALTGNPPKP